MPHESPTILFAGPSLRPELRRRIEKEDIRLSPPVRRFDIPLLLKEGFRGTLIIVDGYFYQDMSVGHAEIRGAIDAGCHVFGLSSMGAIRAYELKDWGMAGFGKVYEWFFRMDDFQDDEVALLHESDEPFRSMSEPLIHIRECLGDLIDSGAASKEEADKVLTAMKEQFFGTRTLDRLSAYLEAFTRADAKMVIKGFERYRIKHSDLEDFIRLRVWEQPPGSVIGD